MALEIRSGKAGSSAVRRLDQHDAGIAFRVDAVEPMGDHLAQGPVQLGGELRAGRAGADDRDMKLARADRLGLRLRAQAGIDQPPVEARRLGWRFQPHGMFRSTRRAEIVRHAADRDHENVVINGARRRDLAPFIIERGADMEFPGAAIEPDHFTETVAEAMPMRLGEIVHLMGAGIEAAGGDFVQQGFPQMRARAFHQRDARFSFPAQPVAEPGHELKPRGAAADHDDVRTASRLVFCSRRG